MPKLSKETIEKIREEVKRGRSRYKVAAEFGVSPRTVYDYTEDLPKKWKKGISQDVRKLILEKAKEGESRLQISKDVGVSYQTVSKIARETLTLDPRWPSVKGKALELLRELSDDGYSLCSDKRTFRKVREFIPLARRVNFKGQTICFLEEKKEEALNLFLGNKKMRIRSYRELKTLSEMFGVELDREKKRYLIDKFLVKEDFFPG